MENAQGMCVPPHRPFSKGPTAPIEALKKSEGLMTDLKSDDLKTDKPASHQNLTVSILSKEVLVMKFFYHYFILRIRFTVYW